MTLPSSSPSLQHDLRESLFDALRYTFDTHCDGWPLDNGSLDIIEGVRQSIRLWSAGYLSFLEGDPAYPTLLRMQSPWRQMQLPSPDAVYHYTRLNGAYTYRIKGKRGSAHVFQLSTWNNNCSSLTDYRLVAKADSATDERLSADSEVDIILSRTPHEGLWLELPEGECELFIRQYYADWDTEKPAELVIERVGAIYPPPSLTQEVFNERMKMVNDWLRTQSNYFVKSVRRHLAANPGQMEQLDIPEAFQDNRYIVGHYRCEMDEAILLEFTPPKGVFWSLQLSNIAWEAMDYHMRQSSLNHHQAAVDTDGNVRMIISQRDPGIANWLDSSGRSLGLLAGRWYRCDDAPRPTLRKIAFDRIDTELPADALRLSAEERQASVQRRLISNYARMACDQ